MAIIDRDLVRALNTGSCFGLVGNGPSIEMGTPSWIQLARVLIDEIKNDQNVQVIKRLEALLQNKQCPEVFDLIEDSIGYPVLIKIVKTKLTPKKSNGQLYTMIASWPFDCYMTTNYDNFLLNHLNEQDASFIIKLNSENDMLLIRADAKGIIFKIHGDFSDPENMILTKRQYDHFRKHLNKHYWREKINSAFHMMNIIVIGYSASDPDLLDQLENAQKLAAFHKPIFMFASGFSLAKINEYLVKYNIRIISYDNEDGSHNNLKRLLKTYSYFIRKRNSPHRDLSPIDESKAIAAASLYLFS